MDSVFFFEKLTVAQLVNKFTAFLCDPKVHYSADVKYCISYDLCSRKGVLKRFNNHDNTVVRADWTNKTKMT
jgi:hypothetical protein